MQQLLCLCRLLTAVSAAAMKVQLTLKEQERCKATQALKRKVPPPRPQAGSCLHAPAGMMTHSFPTCRIRSVRTLRALCGSSQIHVPSLSAARPSRWGAELACECVRLHPRCSILHLGGCSADSMVQPSQPSCAELMCWHAPEAGQALPTLQHVGSRRPGQPR